MAWPWTTPITWAASVYGAADFNAQIRDNQNFLRRISVRQIEDAVISASTTFENLKGLRFYGLAGEVWAFVGTIFWVSNATADAKWTLQAPKGSTGIFGMGHSLPITDSWSTTFGTAIAGGSTTTVEDSFSISGLVTFGRRGEAYLQASQNTASGTTTFYDYSYLAAWRIPS